MLEGQCIEFSRTYWSGSIVQTNREGKMDCSPLEWTSKDTSFRSRPASHADSSAYSKQMDLCMCDFKGKVNVPLIVTPHGKSSRL